MNGTSGHIQGMTISQSEKSFAICITVVLIPLIVAGNLLVMTSYKINRRLRTRTYTFLINLAVSDVIVGGVNLPMWIFCMVNYGQCTSRTFQMVFKFLDRFGAFASIFHLTALSIERYIAVVRPYLFNRLPKRVFFGVSAFAWILSMLMASLSWLNITPFYTKTYNVAVFIIGFVVPAIIVISMYFGIFKAVKSLMKRTPILCGRQNNGQNSTMREDRKVAVTVAVISGLFIVAWLPFFLLSIIASFCPRECLPGNFADVLRMVAAVKWLHYSNSGVNPIIYALRDQEMRKTFKAILGIKRIKRCILNPCRDVDKQDDHSGIGQQTSVRSMSCSSKRHSIM